MRKFQLPLIVYMQLSTQEPCRRTSTMNQCDGDRRCRARRFRAGAITYEYGLCKFVLEVSVSLIADKIKERLGQNRASRVLPRCCNSG